MQHVQQAANVPHIQIILIRGGMKGLSWNMVRTFGFFSLVATSRERSAALAELSWPLFLLAARISVSSLKSSYASSFLHGPNREN